MVGDMGDIGGCADPPVKVHDIDMDIDCFTVPISRRKLALFCFSFKNIKSGSFIES